MHSLKYILGIHNVLRLVRWRTVSKVASHLVQRIQASISNHCCTCDAQKLSNWVHRLFFVPMIPATHREKERKIKFISCFWNNRKNNNHNNNISHAVFTKLFFLAFCKMYSMRKKNMESFHLHNTMKQEKIYIRQKARGERKRQKKIVIKRFLKWHRWRV